MPTPVYILAGQSNATALSGKNGGASPAQEFAALTGTSSVKVATVASDGAPLTWGRSDPDWYHPDELLDQLVTSITTQLSQPGAYLANILWIQGEGDTWDFTRAAEYGARLVDLVDRLELALAPLGIHAADFRFTVLAISAHCPGSLDRANWAAIRAQQLALNDPRIDVVDVDTVAAQAGIDPADLFQADGMHYTARANAHILSAMMDGGALQLVGTSDNDNMAGLAGQDTLRGGLGDDVLNGRSGDDILGGWRGDDTLYAGAGNDVINSGSGKDMVFGGLGADIFNFSDRLEVSATAANHDRIMDFASGQDVINLSLIDADPSRAGNQAFHFLGQSGFDGKAGALRVWQTSGGIEVACDLNGDGQADLAFTLSGLTALAVSDFLL